MTDYPTTVDCGGTLLTLVHFEAAHLGAVKAFAQSLPAHDILRYIAPDNVLNSQAIENTAFAEARFDIL